MSSEPTPTEDLMREHGILNRIMLIYENVLYKINNKINFDLNLISDAGKIVKDFIEDYHEPMEEKYIFSFLLEKNMHVDLIKELINQHRLSKIITDKIIKYTIEANFQKISKYIQVFLYMYRAHESREDTIIFNQFRTTANEKMIRACAEAFEETEHKLFGINGYNTILSNVMGIEVKLGIHDLKIYTPIINH